MLPVPEFVSVDVELVVIVPVFTELLPAVNVKFPEAVFDRFTPDANVMAPTAAVPEFRAIVLLLLFVMLAFRAMPVSALKVRLNELAGTVRALESVIKPPDGPAPVPCEESTITFVSNN